MIPLPTSEYMMAKKINDAKPNYHYLTGRYRPDGSTVTDQLECEFPPDAEGSGDHGPQHTHKGEAPSYIDSARQ